MRAPFRRSRLLAGLVLVVVLLTGCASPEEAPRTRRGESLGAHEESKDLPEDGYYLFPFGAHVPVDVVVSFEVTDGGPIDAFLATGDACRAWGERGFAPSDARLDARRGTIERTVPAGDLCLALDNASFGFGKAQPEGPVSVRFNVTLYERVPE